MEQFDREDSSNYVREPAPVAPQPEPKKKKSRTALVLSLLLILALLGAASFGWLWFQQSGRVDNLEADLSSSRNKVSQLESASAAEAKLDENSNDEVTTDTNGSESDSIIKAALAAAQAEDGPSGLKATLVKQEGDFAQVSITTSGAGYAQILKKSNDIWVVVTTGQGEPSQEIIDRYDIPASILKS